MRNNKTNSTNEGFIDSESNENEYLASTLFEKKVIKDFTDLIILKHLQKYPLVSGYEILNYLRQKFDLTLSPGTVYGAIYSLERHGWIEGDGTEIGRAYKVTNEGEKMIDTAFKSRKRIQRLFVNILLG